MTYPTKVQSQPTKTWVDPSEAWNSSSNCRRGGAQKIGTFVNFSNDWSDGDMSNHMYVYIYILYTHIYIYTDR